MQAQETHREQPTIAPTTLRTRHGSQVQGLITHVCLIALGTVMVYPILWMLASSFKPVETIFTDISLIPKSFSWSSYTEGWNALPNGFETFFINSFIVSTASVVGNVLSCSMAAFAFARIDFKLKKFWFAIMMLTLMLPLHVLIVPQYILYQKLDWLNTYLPLIVPNFLATGAFFIFLMVQFMRSIPRDLDEAAKIDGASPYQIYAHIMMPLSVPALVTTAIFTFMWTWDEFLGPLLYLTDVDKYTVPLALRLFLDSTGESSWGMLFAMSLLSLLPVFAIFLLFQRMLVQGISTTGLKG